MFLLLSTLKIYSLFSITYNNRYKCNQKKKGFYLFTGNSLREGEGEEEENRLWLHYERIITFKGILISEIQNINNYPECGTF